MEKFPEQAARINVTLAQLLAEGKIRPQSKVEGAGGKSSTDARVCSVISNWTGLPVFFWTIVARSRRIS